MSWNIMIVIWIVVGASRIHPNNLKKEGPGCQKTIQAHSDQTIVIMN